MMDDLISRQDALKALDEMSYKSPHESATSVVRKKHFREILEKFIMQQPSARSADAVEVVRCKECVENDAQNWCWKFGYTMHDGDFCSFGERKTDG